MSFAHQLRQVGTELQRVCGLYQKITPAPTNTARLFDFSSACERLVSSPVSCPVIQDIQRQKHRFLHRQHRNTGLPFPIPLGFALRCLFFCPVKNTALLNFCAGLCTMHWLCILGSTTGLRLPIVYSALFTPTHTTGRNAHTGTMTISSSTLSRTPLRCSSCTTTHLCYAHIFIALKWGRRNVPAFLSSRASPLSHG